MKSITYLVLILLLSSCFKDEDKREKNSKALVSMPLGEDYGNVFYYNMSTNAIVSQNDWSDWDLAFYAQEDDFYIKLNHGANMKAYKPENISFDSSMKFDQSWVSKIDDPKGDKEKNALQYTIKNISNDTTYYNDNTYVLELGSNALGELLGYKKISLLYTYLNQYRIKYANLDNTESYEITIAKDVTVNHVYFSFKENGKQLNIEPDKSTWDLVFTRSTDEAFLADEYVSDYSVTSVLLNTHSSKAYMENEELYEEFTLEKIDYSKFTNQLNALGYNWKVFDLNTGIYTTKENQFYILKDINDFYYKINFLSFYDPETNLKGTMSFEYEIIK